MRNFLFRAAVVGALLLGPLQAGAASTTNFSDQWWVPAESGLKCSACLRSAAAAARIGVVRLEIARLVVLLLRQISFVLILLMLERFCFVVGLVNVIRSLLRRGSVWPMEIP